MFLGRGARLGGCRGFLLPTSSVRVVSLRFNIQFQRLRSISDKTDKTQTKSTVGQKEKNQKGGKGEEPLFGTMLSGKGDEWVDHYIKHMTITQALAIVESDRLVENLYSLRRPKNVDGYLAEEICDMLGLPIVYHQDNKGLLVVREHDPPHIKQIKKLWHEHMRGRTIGLDRSAQAIYYPVDVAPFILKHSPKLTTSLK